MQRDGASEANFSRIGDGLICCQEMDRAMDREVVVKTAKQDIHDGRLWNDISSEYFVRSGTKDRYDYWALNYCPFCGKALSLGLWAAEKKK